ncbi:MAG TPA: DUF6356 family protein [Burkholderiaceae bacterium]|nr:DUF6356 family protein [Burkholderiaceae bacterium]
MNARALFTEHPRAVGETYLQHLRNAAGFGLALVAAGAACLVHAVLPFVFERTASQAVERLHARMRARHRS